jgi:drug/metabolite transporter (DMT)-like permease
LLGEVIALAQVPGMILVTLGLVLVVWSSQRTAGPR